MSEDTYDVNGTIEVPNRLVAIETLDGDGKSRLSYINPAHVAMVEPSGRSGSLIHLSTGVAAFSALGPQVVAYGLATVSAPRTLNPNRPAPVPESEGDDE